MHTNEFVSPLEVYVVPAGRAVYLAQKKKKLDMSTLMMGVDESVRVACSKDQRVA
jgi:hypothetical protein